MKILNIWLGCALLGLGNSAMAECFDSINTGSSDAEVRAACGEPDTISDASETSRDRVEVYRGLSREGESVRQASPKSEWIYYDGDQPRYRFVIIDGYVIEKHRP